MRFSKSKKTTASRAEMLLNNPNFEKESRYFVINKMNINNPKILEEDPNFRDIGVAVEVFEEDDFVPFEGDELIGRSSYGGYILHKYKFQIISQRPNHIYRSSLIKLHESFKEDRIIEKFMQFLKKILDPVSYSMIKFEQEEDIKRYTVPGFFQLYGMDLRENNKKFNNVLTKVRKTLYSNSIDINKKNDLIIEFDRMSENSYYINFGMYENKYVSTQHQYTTRTTTLRTPQFYFQEVINNSNRMAKFVKFVDSVYNMLRDEAKEAAKSTVDIVGMKTGQDIPEAQTLIQNFAYGKSKRERDIDRSPAATSRNTERSRKKYLMKEYKKFTRSRRLSAPRPPINALQQIKKDYTKPRSLAPR
jgi:hypothetical protein